jgi:lysophospholipase L1-like esterase
VRHPRFERYVAIGDSSTEGLDDPDGGGGYRGWANRLAERIASAQGSILYANLGVRGRLTRQVHDEQLPRALAMRPDLVTLFTGSNDFLERDFDPQGLRRDVEAMQRALIEGGATVLTFTFPDLEPVFSLARLLRERVTAMNKSLREASAASGAILVDFAGHEVGSDPRLWSEDRFHANAVGHARIAHALAHALGLPDADDSWQTPLPSASRPSRLSRLPADLVWGLRYATGWALLQLQSRRPGEDRSAKRPDLAPVHARNVTHADGVH